MQLNKEQLLEWQSHPVTRALRTSIFERINDGHIALENSSDGTYDQTIKGIIKGLREVLDWQPEVTEEENSDEI